jgi:hypothetical protein
MTIPTLISHRAPVLWMRNEVKASIAPILTLENGRKTSPSSCSSLTSNGYMPPYPRLISTVQVLCICQCLILEVESYN